MRRLCRQSLADLPPAIARPTYDLDAVGIGHAHLGVGAFHRGHQAEYADDLLAAVPGRWAIVGINLRPPDLPGLLGEQDGLYSRVLRQDGAQDVRVLGAIRRVLMADADAGRALVALADPAVTVVTLTVTEKGLCHVPATGELDSGHPDIVHDRDHPARPRSAPGLLVAMLRARRQDGTPPPALISCDNIRDNGQVLRRVVTGLAAMTDPELAAWIEDQVDFPGTMVDRIVPATRPEDVDELAATLGVRDDAAVVGEPFRQWVIEDRFRRPRPPWEHAGAQLVDDVRPYEIMKMRLLNGSQSALAPLGWLAGCRHMSDAMARPALAGLVRAMMAHESAPTVAIDEDLGAYQAAVLRRLSNPALRHTTWQIATDGSQKIPQRLLAPIRERLAAGAPFPRLALAVAGWMQFVSGRDLQGAAIAVPDPLAPVLARAAATATDEAELVAALLRVEAVFGSDLHRAAPVHAAITGALRALRRHGPEMACAHIETEFA